MKRSVFLKKSCTAIVCGCGFSALYPQAVSFAGEDSTKANTDSFEMKWLEALLNLMEKENDAHKNKALFSEIAFLHYEQLDMSTLLAQYENNLNGFLNFLSDSWGWSIEYDLALNRIMADENKNTCVCPLVKALKNPSSVICYCSEGFARKMFSSVTGKETNVRVISSILRGDKSCKYQIDIA